MSSKLDFSANEVRRLYCTFKRLPFYTEEAVSNATGKKHTLLYITFDSSATYQYYTSMDPEVFVDVGWLYHEGDAVLAFSSRELVDGMDYVVDYGRIVYADIYGPRSDVRIIVKIESVHQEEQLDRFISRNMPLIAITMSFGMVIASSLSLLPFIEYDVNGKIREGMSKQLAS